MAWSSPKTWATGDILTAADMNSYVRDQFLYIAGSTGRVDLSTVSKHISLDSLIIKTLGM